MDKVEENTLTVYVSANNKQIVIPTPNWEEVLKFNTIMFLDDKGHQLTSGAFFDNRGERSEVEKRIRCMAHDSMKQHPAYIAVANDAFQYMVSVNPRYLTTPNQA